jgi:PEGA domain
MAETPRELATAPAVPEAPPPPAMGDSSGMQEAPPVAEAPKEPTTAPAVPETLPPPAPRVAEPTPPPTAAAPAPKVLRAAAPMAKISEPQPGGMARLIIAVSPKGELYIDGKHYGTTPPLTTLDLEPGMRRIEVRSGSWKPYVTYMTIQAGDERRIRHDFAAKSSRPPR